MQGIHLSSYDNLPLPRRKNKGGGGLKEKCLIPCLSLKGKDVYSVHVRVLQRLMITRRSSLKADYAYAYASVPFPHPLFSQQ